MQILKSFFSAFFKKKLRFKIYLTLNFSYIFTKNIILNLAVTQLIIDFLK